MWHGDVVWCHKVGTTNEAFQEQAHLWEKGASVGVDFGLFNYQDPPHAQQTLNHWRKVKKKKKKKKKDITYIYNLRQNVLRLQISHIRFDATRSYGQHMVSPFHFCWDTSPNKTLHSLDSVLCVSVPSILKPCDFVALKHLLKPLTII